MGARKTADRYLSPEQSPELITINAIAADVIRLRIESPNATRRDVVGALLLSARFIWQMVVQPNDDADKLERELVRIAALAVRAIEAR